MRITLFGKMISKLLKNKNEIEVRDTDVYLVSYPKSGNTWMRFLLINYFYNKKGKLLSYDDLEKYIPSIYKSQISHINSIKGSRIIKSHSIHNHYPKIIYILRDGRDALVSYYHFQRELVDFEGTFKDYYFANRDKEVGTWDEHLSKALKFKNDNPDKILFIKYEDLKNNQHITFKKVISFLDVKLNEDQLAFAIQNSSFENLKKMQEDEGVNIEGKNINFFRKGKIGTWKNYFDNEIKKDFYEKSKKHLERFNYNIDE